MASGSSDEEGGVWQHDEAASIIRSFPFAREEIIEYYLQMKMYGIMFKLIGCLVFVVPLYNFALQFRNGKLFLFALPALVVTHALLDYILWAKPNLQDSINARHCAVTADSVMFIKDRHLTGCRLACNWEGRYRKTIPLEKITDVEVLEPAGRTMCGLMEEKLTTINIQTASTSGVELSLDGLVDPQGFRRLVFDMKKGGSAQRAGGASAQEMLHLGGSSREVVIALREMHGTLKNIEVLLAKQGQRA